MLVGYAVLYELLRLLCTVVLNMLQGVGAWGFWNPWQKKRKNKMSTKERGKGREERREESKAKAKLWLVVVLLLQQHSPSPAVAKKVCNNFTSTNPGPSRAKRINE